MKLSVILPCFNGARTIAIQLEALARQQWTGVWELIVVNNGSTDQSMTIVEQYRNCFPDVKIVDAYKSSGQRRGVAYSYTVGLEAATGDAFVFCEADDEVGTGWLAAMAEALEQHDFVASALEYSRLNQAWLVANAWGQQSAGVGLSTMSPPLFLPYASGCSFGMKRIVYETVGAPDETCMAAWDTDYCWRAHLAGIELHFAPEAVLHYRLRHKHLERYRQGLKWAESHAVLLRKYSQPFSAFKLLRYFVRKGWAFLTHLLKLVLCLHSRKRFAEWVWGLGWTIGELQGAFKYLPAQSACQSS